jgi:hypothetical protein
MLHVVLAVFIVLWLLGAVQINGFTLPHLSLFTVNNHVVTLANLLLMLATIWLIDLLPSPFRQIAALLLLLYVLSILGVIAIAGFSNIIAVAIIVGVVIALFQKK